MKTFKLLLLSSLSAVALLLLMADGTPVGIATTQRAGSVKPDGTTITITSDGTISSIGGGGASNGITAAQFTAGVSSGTNLFKGTNLNVTEVFTGGLIVTNGFTNISLTALTDLEADANKKVVSLGNAFGVKTNDGSGHVGYTLVLPWLDAQKLTNVLNGSKIFAGANISVTLAVDAVTGATNATIALLDPASLGQMNVGAAWVTNFLTPTNNTGGTTVDFSNTESTTNMAGNMSITGVANLTAGAYNHKIIHCLPNGSDRTITYPVSWGQGLGDTLVATNNDQTDLLVSCQPGVFTNILQRTIIPHP